VLLHRLVLARKIGRPLERGEEVDHINRNGLDNRRCNLRLATRSQNCANKPAYRTNRSGYKGVRWSSRAQKWIAYIRVRGQHKYLGRHTTPEAAHQAYLAAAIEAFGEFAHG